MEAMDLMHVAWRNLAIGRSPNSLLVVLKYTESHLLGCRRAILARRKDFLGMKRVKLL